MADKIDEVIDDVMAIVVDTGDEWVDVYLFDSPQKVDCVIDDDQGEDWYSWQINDQWTEFRFNGASITVDEPVGGTVIDANTDLDEVEAWSSENIPENLVLKDKCDWDEEGCLVVSDDSYDPALKKYIQNGYRFYKQNQPKTLMELLDQLRQLGKVIFIAGP